jgi:hypothetical protein
LNWARDQSASTLILGFGQLHHQDGRCFRTGERLRQSTGQSLN